jgi:hypothetical protein
MAFLKKKNCARTTINQVGGLNATDLSVTVSDASQLPSSGDFLVTIWDKTSFPDPCDDSNTEIVKVTDVSGNVLTIVRGQEDTTGKVHANGQAVEMLITAGTFEELEDGINTHIDSKTNPHSVEAIQVPTNNEDINSDTKLMLHMNSLDNSPILDSSPSNHSFTNVGNIDYDLLIKKFGVSSLLFDGSSHIYTPDSTDWDIFATTTEDWTIDYWLYIDDFTVLNSVIFEQSKAIPSGSFRHLNFINQNGRISWVLQYTLSTINLFSTEGIISEGKLHHIVLIKKANEYGIYVDGIQVAYVFSNTTATLDGKFYIGYSITEDNWFLNGRLDEFRITKDLLFNASPNVGLTDTITPPVEEYQSNNDVQFKLDNLNSAYHGKEHSLHSSDDHGDVDITNLSAYDGLIWDGTKWINLPSPFILSLFAQDLNGDLQPFEDYFGQTGLFELDASFNRQPKTTEEIDLFFELDINNDIIPKA